MFSLKYGSNIGDITTEKFIFSFGSSEAGFKENKHKLIKTDGIGCTNLIKFLMDQRPTCPAVIPYVLNRPVETTDKPNSQKQLFKITKNRAFICTLKSNGINH